MTTPATPAGSWDRIFEWLDAIIEALDDTINHSPQEARNV